MARELLLLLLAPGCVSAFRAHAHLHLRQQHAPMTRTVVAVAPIEAGHQRESSAATSTLIRATRFQQSVKKLSSSTSVHPQRIAHAACGAVALVLGAKLMGNCAVDGWASPMNHIEVISCAVFSVISSLLGVIRLEWNNPNEAARNTFIWPVAVQNMWILGVFVSDYTNAAGDALFSFRCEPFLSLTALVMALSFWQISQSWVAGGDTEKDRQRSGIWFDNGFANAVATSSLYGAPLIAATVQVLWVATFVNPADFSEVLIANPEYGHIFTNTWINFVFLNCVGVFFSTLIKYRVCNTSQVVTIYFPTLIYSALAIIVASLQEIDPKTMAVLGWDPLMALLSQILT